MTHDRTWPIERHEVQLLINRSITNLEIKCLKFFFKRKHRTTLALFINVENCAKHCKKAIKALLPITIEEIQIRPKIQIR